MCSTIELRAQPAPSSDGTFPYHLETTLFSGGMSGVAICVLLVLFLYFSANSTSHAELPHLIPQRQTVSFAAFGIPNETCTIGMAMGASLGKEDRAPFWRANNIFLAIAALFTTSAILFLWKTTRHNRVPPRKTDAPPQFQGSYTASDLMLNTAFDMVSDAIVIVDSSGKILLANKQFCTIAGVDAVEVTHHLLREYVCSEAASKHDWDPILDRVLSGEKLTLDLGISSPGAQTVAFDGEMMFQSSIWNGKRVVLGVTQDINKQKQVEQATLERVTMEAQLRTIFESLPVQFWACDASGRCILQNSLSADHLGPCLGLKLEEIGLPPALMSQFQENNRRAMSGEVVKYEMSVETKEGQRQYMSIVAPIRVGDQIIGILGTNVDITERVNAQQAREKLSQQLRQSQKLEAIGTLAGGIAHDFNNILGAIICYAELAQMDVEDKKATLAHLGQVLVASHRAKELVSQILAFSRHSSPEKRPMDIRPVLKESMKLLRSAIPSTIEMEVAIEETLPKIMADPAQLHQVIMNLCNNSLHAMRHKPGRLIVKAQGFELAQEMAHELPDCKPGTYLKLTVADTGEGMEMQTQTRIFEPFFTTHPPGESTGLGLSVVHGIIKDHDGFIQVYSQPNQGATFHVYLPALHEESTSAPAVTSDIIPGQGETILYVDDEAILCRAMEKLLTRCGYHVEVFADPGRAIKQFEKNPEQYDMVITDMTMPGMTGPELAQAIHKLRPETPILLATGFHAQDCPQPFSETGILDILHKPFNQKELTLCIHKHLKNAPTP